MTRPRERIPEHRGAGRASQEELTEQLAAEKAADNALASIRGGAEKWQAVIATILGLFAVSGLVKGPDDFAKVDPAWQSLIPLLLAAAVLFGLGATYLAARAAFGLPRLVWSFGNDYASARRAEESNAATSLNRAIIGALVAFLCFASVVGILWFAPRAPKDAKLSMITTRTQLACGEIKGAVPGALKVADRLSGGDVTIQPGDILVLQPVSSCPAQ